MNKAPSFFLTAIGAARVIGGPPGPAAPLLLIFHGYAGSRTALDINASIREKYPETDQIFIASVVDLHHIPRYMRTAVELTLSAAYRDAAKHVPEERDPTEYVVIVPDWDGKVTASFGMEDRVDDIGLVVVTQPWTIFDTYNGPGPLVAVEKMVAAVIKQSPGATVKSTTIS